MTPLRPEHADKVSTPPGVECRVQVRRRLVGYAYPVNGNVHNPTPEYAWDVLADGRLVDSYRLRRQAVEFARNNSAQSMLV